MSTCCSDFPNCNCEVKLSESDKKAVSDFVDNWLPTEVAKPDTSRKYTYEIPPEKEQEIDKYALSLRKKNPKINNREIIRKTAKKFNLKKITIA